MYLYRKLEQKNCFRIFAVARPRWTAPSSPKWTRYGRASAMTTNWYMSNYLQMYSLNLIFSYSAVYTMCDPVKSSPVPGWNEGLCLIPEHHQGQSSGPEWAPWHPSQVAIRTCTYVVQNNFCCVPRARIYLDGMSPEEFVERCPLAAVYRD